MLIKINNTQSKGFGINLTSIDGSFFFLLNASIDGSSYTSRVVLHIYIYIYSLAVIGSQRSHRFCTFCECFPSRFFLSYFGMLNSSLATCRLI